MWHLENLGEVLDGGRPSFRKQGPYVYQLSVACRYTRMCTFPQSITPSHADPQGDREEEEKEEDVPLFFIHTRSGDPGLLP